MLKVIAGRWRGRGIVTPSDRRLRPTTAKLRESVFSQLQGFVYEARFLDLYAGTGMMGFEALSRGAATCLAVEKHPQHVAMILDNVKRLNISHQEYSLLQRDVPVWIQHANKLPAFDLVYVDPPYEDSNQMETIVMALFQPNYLWLHEDSIVMVEQDKHADPLPEIEGREMQRREYGRSVLSVYKPAFIND
ncbi:MAG: 16S rRNA (guanine(966)-N(2))-methyltransferase RsmD [Cyanobacteria bacterium]|nr:16S rRNA (guanine(966)-N(2))-methyltransferase RsmD [Cyanobacteriota bacterium]